MKAVAMEAVTIMQFIYSVSATEEINSSLKFKGTRPESCKDFSTD